MSGTALRAFDISAALATVVPPVSVVLNVGQSTYLDDEMRPLSDAVIAERQGVNVIEIRHASWAMERGYRGDLLVMDSSRLLPFFAGWSPYNVDVLSLRSRPSHGEIDEVALAVNTRQRGDPPLLKSLAQAETYVGGHDDCYFYIEARERRSLTLIWRRLLALLAGSYLLGASETIEVSEPEDAIVNELVARADTWIGDAAVAETGTVAIDLTVGEWRLGQSVPHDPTFALKYTQQGAQWTLHPSASA